MKAIKLNEKENAVYQACIEFAKRDGDNGYEFIIDGLNKATKISIQSLKGYLSQLVQKGLLTKFDDCYFDFGVVELTPDYDKIPTFNYEFNIIVE